MPPTDRTIDVGYSIDDVLHQAEKVYPKAAPAWLKSFASLLIQMAPSILAWFMSLPAKPPALLASSVEPDETDRGVAALAAIHDLQAGPSTHIFAGPAADPIVASILDRLADLATQSAPAAIQAVKSYAESLISRITP